MTLVADSRVATRVGLMCAGALLLVPPLVWQHTYPIPSFHQEWTAFVLGTAAMVALVAHPQWPGKGWPAVAGLPALLIAVFGLQALLGMHAYAQQTLTVFLYLLWAAALMHVGSFLRECVGAPLVTKALAVALACGAFVSALIGIVQCWGSPAALTPFVMQPVLARAYGNLGQPNLYADHLGLGVVSLAYLCARTRWAAPACACAAVPILLAMAMSGSRSAWLVLIVPAVIALAGRYRHLDAPAHASRRLLPATAFALATFAAAQLLLIALGDLAGETPVERMFGRRTSWLDRLEVWWDACRMAVSAPSLGVGFGQFAFARFGLVDPAVGVEVGGIYTHAHNLVFHLLAEAGVPTVLASTWLVWRWLRRVLGEIATHEQWWMLSVIGVVGVHSAVEYPLWNSTFLGVVALAAGIGDRTHVSARMRAARPVAAIALVLSVVTIANTWRDYRGVQRLYAGPDGVASPSVLLRESGAIEVRSIFVPYIEQAYSTLIRIDRHDLAAALAQNSRVLRFAPDAPVAFRQALLLALSGDRDAAVLTWRRARVLFPLHAVQIQPLVRALALDEPDVFGPLADVGD